VCTSVLRRGLRDRGGWQGPTDQCDAGSVRHGISPMQDQPDAGTMGRRISATGDQRSEGLMRQVHFGDARRADPLEADAAVDPGHLLARGAEEDEFGAVVEGVPSQQRADGGAESAAPC
jgi:hypothetical protein